MTQAVPDCGGPWGTKAQLSDDRGTYIDWEPFS